MIMSKWASVKDVTEYDGGGSGYKPIPDKTLVRGVIEQVKHRRYQNDPANPLSVELMFRVLEPEVYTNRVVYLNLHINDPDEKRAGRAMSAYAAIDSQMALHYVGPAFDTTVVDYLIEQQDQHTSYEQLVNDETLTKAWVGQGMQMLTIRLGLMTNDEGKQYQWLMQVLPAGSSAEEAPATKAKATPTPMASMAKMKKPPAAPKALLPKAPPAPSVEASDEFMEEDDVIPFN